MISPELEAQILRLFHAEHWKVGTISRQLRVHRNAIQRVLAQHGVPRPSMVRNSKLESFVPFIEETLRRFPSLPASRLFEMCRARGPVGGADHFRHFVATLRPRAPAEAYLRLRTLPGEQAQVDWGHFGALEIGRAHRPLLAFVMVLSFSRRIFLRFYFGGHTANFLRGHQAAFEHFGGVPRKILYDNLKSAVLERIGDAIRFNPLLVQFATHHCFEPIPVAVARGNEKGRVERAIGYIRRSFFLGRSFRDLDDLNAQALDWCQGPADQRRCPEDERASVRETFEAERPRLLPLPDNPFPVEERVEVSAGKTPYVRFDGNDYSVPHDKVRRLLVVRASLVEVRIFDGIELVATHHRSFDRKAVIEDQRHIQALVDEKRHARSRRGVDRLSHALPHAQELLRRMAERGANLGSETSQLVKLLELFGSQALDKAIVLALEKDVLHHHAIRQIVEREREQRGLAPALAVELPDDPRVRGLFVEPHPLTSYDDLIDGPRADEASQAKEDRP